MYIIQRHTYKIAFLSHSFNVVGGGGFSFGRLKKRELLSISVPCALRTNKCVAAKGSKKAAKKKNKNSHLFVYFIQSVLKRYDGNIKHTATIHTHLNMHTSTTPVVKKISVLFVFLCS